MKRIIILFISIFVLLIVYVSTPSVSEEQMDEFISLVADSGVDFTNLGVVTHGEIIVDEVKFGNISEYSKLYQEKLESEMAY